jgi:prepilin-type N-terminal cleavage/methylation domain-containing protein
LYMRDNPSGLTLIEVLVVCVILGILAALGLANYAGPKEQAMEKEAKLNLKLIASAEKIYRMEIGGYVTCPATTDLNNNLKLMLPASDSNWRYKVDATATTFLAKAQRVGGFNPNRIVCIDNTLENTTNSSAFCAPW